MVCVDEYAAHLHPRLAKAWQKRGHPVRVPAAGADRKVVLLGAPDYATGQVHWQLSLRKDSTAFVTLPDQLRRAWLRTKLVTVLAHAGYHTSSPTAAWGRQGHRQICPVFLPAYSPELHLMERVWRTVKNELSCPRGWADWPALGEATETLLAPLNARSHRGKGLAIERVHNFCATT
jgi:DDE superfamily endonuclease